jgi:hypothetical protein
MTPARRGLSILLRIRRTRERRRVDDVLVDVVDEAVNGTICGEAYFASTILVTAYAVSQG